MLTRLLRVFAAFVLMAATAASWSQTYPSKPITVLVPFSSGGTVDIVARILGQHMTKEFGRPLVIDNRGGAGGNIASGMLARAAPDGHTLMFHHMGLAFNASLYERLPFDTQRDLIPVAYIGVTPNVLVVTNSFPGKTVQDFLAEAKARPNTINFGSGGVGSAGHLPMELLQSMAGITMLHVPYKGSGQAITDLMAGQIQTMLLTIPAVMPFIQSGQVRAIATSGPRRSPALPTLPTLDEAGVKGFDYTPWYGVFAPAGTPVAVLDKIHAAVNKAIDDPEIRQKLAGQGMEVEPLSRAAFGEMVTSDIGKWNKIIKKLNIRATE
jgi:tripartite-type tricarboxylate transporter receptor subunit TctC